MDHWQAANQITVSHQYSAKADLPFDKGVVFISLDHLIVDMHICGVHQCLDINVQQTNKLLQMHTQMYT